MSTEEFAKSKTAKFVFPVSKCHKSWHFQRNRSRKTLHRCNLFRISKGIVSQLSIEPPLPPNWLAELSVCQESSFSRSCTKNFCEFFNERWVRIFGGKYKIHQSAKVTTKKSICGID